MGYGRKGDCGGTLLGDQNLDFWGMLGEELADRLQTQSIALGVVAQWRAGFRVESPAAYLGGHEQAVTRPLPHHELA